jgi:HME family heavy-metal exporter
MFDAIIHSSLRQRLIVLGLALLMVIYGIFTLQKMPVDVFPDLNKPTVTLMTEAGGMAPEEVEQLVSFPIESGMNGMAGVTRVRSVSAWACRWCMWNLNGAPTSTATASRLPSA